MRSKTGEGESNYEAFKVLRISNDPHLRSRTVCLLTDSHKFCYLPTMTAMVSHKTAADQPWVERTLQDCWSAQEIVIRAEILDAARLPALIFWRGGERRGLATYRISRPTIELVTLNALDQGLGIGAQLLSAICAEGRKAGCARAVLITTNDNLAALAFYQKRGWRLSGLSVGAVEAARRIKPSIPLTAENGIPIRDEIELSFDFAR